MIKMKDIVREGHPSLRTKCEQVEIPLNKEDQELLEEMLTFVKNSQDDEMREKYDLRAGVGLAAPQIGVSKRLMAVHFEDPDGKEYSYALANPKIISHAVEKAYLNGGEGCLSVDRTVEGYVPRYSRITVRAIDLEGNPVKLRLRNYAAVVFQHEIDHLDGIMFYDHINEANPFEIPENSKEI